MQIFPNWLKILAIFSFILHTANAEHNEYEKFIEFFIVLHDPLCFIWLPFLNELSYRVGIGLILKLFVSTLNIKTDSYRHIRSYLHFEGITQGNINNSYHFFVKSFKDSFINPNQCNLTYRCVIYIKRPWIWDQSQLSDSIHLEMAAWWRRRGQKWVFEKNCFF